MITARGWRLVTGRRTGWCDGSEVAAYRRQEGHEEPDHEACLAHPEDEYPADHGCLILGNLGLQPALELTHLGADGSQLRFHW